MPANFYNWKGFWCPRDGKLNLSDDGFLWNPHSNTDNDFTILTQYPLKIFPNLHVLSFSESLQWCNSTSVQGQKARIDEEISGKGDISLWVDLQLTKPMSDLYKRYLTHLFLILLSGSQNLHFFLDSLDECLLRIDTVAALLGEELPKYPIDRLHLRIACRTADWPATLSIDEVVGRRGF